MHSMFLLLLLLGLDAVTLDNSADFDDMILSTQTKALVVFFTSPHCSFCTRFTPYVDQVEKDLRTVTDIGFLRVDCVKHQPLCDSIGVNALPTIRLYKDRTYADLRRRPYEVWNLKLQILERTFSTVSNLN